MALNWQKLTELQRKHPKAKFASSEIARQLKKRPKDPYLLAWQAENSLQLGNKTGAAIEQILQPLFESQPPITDVRLLSYLYETQVGILTKTGKVNLKYLIQPSAGQPAEKAFKNAAKALPSRKDRLDVWSTLFVNAMREDCWEDVRVALSNATQQEGLKSNRMVVFATIFANQVAFEMNQRLATESKQPLGPAAELPKHIAYRTMKAAFENVAKSPENPIQVSDVRDLRFMAQIFERQGKHEELFKLWDEAPATLKTILEVNHDDMLLLKNDILRKKREWKQLLTCCRNALEEAKAAADQIGTSEAFTKLAETSWRIWSNMMEASRQIAISEGLPQASRLEHIPKFLQSSLPDGSTIVQGRASRLSLLALTHFLGEPLLPLCETFWDYAQAFKSCYEDLRLFVEHFNSEEREKFYKYISTSRRFPVKDPYVGDRGILERWFQVEVNVLKFDYLFTISNRHRLEATVVEAFVANAIRLYKIGTRLNEEVRHDVASLAIFGLRVLAKIAHNPEIRDDAYCSVNNNRLELQAVFLARHFTSGQVANQERPLLLQSIGLYIQLGLASIAFEHYPHVRVKEMLNDTVSHILLTRISQIHPFDMPGKGAIHPDQELATVIRTIEKMESRVDDFLFSDMREFKYDQAFELLDLKRRLNSSLTKHLCVVERRRIARLKGETVDDSLDPSPNTFNDISDNREFGALPTFECSSLRQNTASTNSQTPHGDPGASWLYDFYKIQDIASQVMFKETPHVKIMNRMAHMHALQPLSTGAERNVIEDHMSGAWMYLVFLSFHLYGLPLPLGSTVNNIESKFESLQSEISDLHEMLHGIERSDPETTLPVNQNIPCAGTLMFFYGLLEVLQVSWKVVEVSEEHRKRKDSPLKNKINEATVKKLRQGIEAGYAHLRECVQNWVDLLKKSGIKIVKDQVQWGPTGKALKELLSDDDIDLYAAQTVNSLVDSLSGVLRVKLKR